MGPEDVTGRAATPENADEDIDAGVDAHVRVVDAAELSADELAASYGCPPAERPSLPPLAAAPFLPPITPDIPAYETPPPSTRPRHERSPSNHGVAASELRAARPPPAFAKALAWGQHAGHYDHFDSDDEGCEHLVPGAAVPPTFAKALAHYDHYDSDDDGGTTDALAGFGLCGVLPIAAADV